MIPACPAPAPLHRLGRWVAEWGLLLPVKRRLWEQRLPSGIGPRGALQPDKILPRSRMSDEFGLVQVICDRSGGGIAFPVAAWFGRGNLPRKCLQQSSWLCRPEIYVRRQRIRHVPRPPENKQRVACWSLLNHQQEKRHGGSSGEEGHFGRRRFPD